MVTVEIKEGTSYDVNWFEGMNGQEALEGAYEVSNQGDFTFSLQYYGKGLGYLVDMINETYDTFISKYEPFFFWEFLINGKPSSAGIDNTILNDGDVITFQYVPFVMTSHKDTVLQAKFKSRKMMFSQN